MVASNHLSTLLRSDVGRRQTRRAVQRFDHRQLVHAATLTAQPHVRRAPLPLRLLLPRWRLATRRAPRRSAPARLPVAPPPPPPSRPPPPPTSSSPKRTGSAIPRSRSPIATACTARSSSRLPPSRPPPTQTPARRARLREARPAW